MNDVTRILSAIEQGDPSAAEQLLPLVYDELRKLAAAKLAQEKPGQTLQATALVHEAYVRLVTPPQSPPSKGGEAKGSLPLKGGEAKESPPLKGGEGGVQWGSRGHFFAAAAEAMRRILVENARRKKSIKRGGHLKRVELDEDFTRHSSPDALLALDQALAKLARLDPVKAELVKLRCFAGLSHQEAARVLGISRATADRYWAYAKTRLYCDIFEPEPEKKD